jgi:hypothetical protein
MQTVRPIFPCLEISVSSSRYTAFPFGMSLMTSRREVQSDSQNGHGTNPSSIRLSISLSEGGPVKCLEMIHGHEFVVALVQWDENIGTSGFLHPATAPRVTMVSIFSRAAAIYPAPNRCPS